MASLSPNPNKTSKKITKILCEECNRLIPARNADYGSFCKNESVCALTIEKQQLEKQKEKELLAKQLSLF